MLGSPVKLESVIVVDPQHNVECTNIQVRIGVDHLRVGNEVKFLQPESHGKIVKRGGVGWELVVHEVEVEAVDHVELESQHIGSVEMMGCCEDGDLVNSDNVTVVRQLCVDESHAGVEWKVDWLAHLCHEEAVEFHKVTCSV
eukprot:6473629-Amphidinium_carterae.4